MLDYSVKALNIEVFFFYIKTNASKLLQNKCHKEYRQLVVYRHVNSFGCLLLTV